MSSIIFFSPGTYSTTPIFSDDSWISYGLLRAKSVSSFLIFSSVNEYPKNKIGASTRLDNILALTIEDFSLLSS